MFDINQPQDPLTSGYIWLPVEFEGDRPVSRWRNHGNVSVVAKQ